MILRNLAVVSLVTLGLTAQAANLDVSSINNRKGQTTDQDLKVLSDAILKGTEDDYSTYKEFIPDQRKYVGIIYIDAKKVDQGNFEVKGNFRGPKASYQKWVLRIKNQKARRFESVFVNNNDFDWQWIQFSKGLSDIKDYKDGQGRVVLHLSSNNSKDVALFDQLIIQTAQASTPKPTPEPTPTPAPTPAPTPEKPPVDKGPVQFTPGMTFQWQLQGKINTSIVADVYDIDLEDNESNGVIQELQNKGRKVICYFSAGTVEDWRSDANQFPAAAVGNTNGWPGERWLDTRNQKVRQIMTARMQRAVAAGCDAVEPDNIDAYQNKPGFPISESDQLDFLNFLANTAHDLGISIGLKNTVDLIAKGQLHKVFDWTLNEECYQYQECDTLQAFTNAGKAAFIAEYNDKHLNKCADAKNKGFELVIFNLDLNGQKQKTCN